MFNKNFFSTTLLAVFFICFSVFPSLFLVSPSHAEDSLVLVNSTSFHYTDFEHYIQPYLNNFGVSYTTLDISSESIGSDIGDYNLIIVGHRQLDPDDAYLDPTEETTITLAVNAGTGLVNFDNDLSGDGATPRYEFIDDIFGFSYMSPPTGSGVTFTSEGYTGIRINCWEDDHQDPVLTTTTDPTDLGETDGLWTEFLYTPSRPYPSLLAGADEENNGLPVMRFYTSGIPNGQYEVIANLYTNTAGRDMRYYYGYTPGDPKEYSVDTVGGAGGSDQHEEYSLGTVTITDGTFNIYVQDADLLSGTYPLFGWAWINLVPAQETLINCWEDDHQDPVLATTEIPADIIEDDGAWTEFLYTSSRPYPTILAGVDEEDNGLPLMRFYASGIPNGEYEVFANLYDNAAIRYFYGYTETDPKANFVNTAGGATGDQHEEYSLGTVTITDGNFNIYIQDADLISGSYAFFGWAWIRLVETGSIPPPSVMHYITERHDPGEVISTGTMTLAGITTPETASNLAMTGSQPFLAVTTSGSGNAVQWGTYNWMSHAVKGPIYGLDDLVWRSIVWAARKPFVMQGVPPFVTMRVDDESGPFWWLDIANEFGFKPWAGLFFHNIDDAEAAHLSSLVNAGLATTSIHAFNGGFFYFNHSGSDWPDATIAAYYAEGTQWHLDHNIPISKFMLPHYYEIGTNAFQGLSDWGVEFIGTQMEPGNGYGAPWIMNGPYRNYEAGGSSEGRPGYYADFITVPGHPEFDGQFFNCVTEIRDDAGYEWYPSSDIAGSIGRGTRQTKRALDSMALATLFTHGYFMDGIPPENWRAILDGITTNLEPYNPIYVTLDHACQYIRAMHTSDILDSTYDPVSRQVTATLTGETDISTMFYLFTEEGGNIQETLVDVPTFTGSTDVVYQLAGPLDHITITPSTATVAIGGSQQFTAQGYDADDNPIPNLPFTWNVVSGGGTINPSGLFTAGLVASVYTDTVVASYSGIEAYASVDVVEPALDHFTFDFIYSPQYIDVPFVITITARDISGNPMIGYTGQATLEDSTGTLTPSITGNFVAGEWTGEVAVGQLASEVTITATDGLATGTSNIFYLGNIPSYYDVTSPSYTQTASIPFPVTVTENAIRINCWEDDHQDPVLYTFYDPNQFVPDDNQWDEFKYNLRDYPAVFAGQTENPEMMRFYGAVPNGSYRVIANLYRTNDFRYYYGFDPATPRDSFVEVTTGTIGDFAEFDLGTVTITDNIFTLYTDHADVITDRGAFPYYGWAWIRLVPAQVEYQINCWEDNHQDPVLATTQNIPDLVDNDGVWTEFLYPPVRNYPTILAGADEVTSGLPVMHFFSDGISNGEYEVIANLYTNSAGRDMRYFYGYTESDPNAYYVDTIGGAGGADQHEEYSLGTINITDGTFNIYVQDAELTGTGYNFFGWAWIRLVPVSGDEQINCGEDDHQDPVLVTTTNPADLGETDGEWTEFLYTSSRPYPSILAGIDEELYGLPVMRFYTSGISNGEYEVIANLYTSGPGRDMRYYYGYTPGNPKASYIDTIGGTGGTEEHTEYSLGTVTITDETFNIYVQDADLTGTGYPFFGWAWVRLVSTSNQTMITLSSSSPTMLFDGDEDGIFGEPGDNVLPLLGGTLNIVARDTTVATNVLITAADDFGHSGSNTYSILSPAVNLQLQVALSSDDAEESSTGAMRLTSSDLELVYDGTDQTVGIRFTGVDIPQGANIMSASIQFTADKTSSVATFLVIEGEDIDDAPTFTLTNSNISDRIKTGASVPWVPLPWTVGESGPAQQTPDLSPVIQEIVNRSGWTNGNALAVIITGTGKQTAVSYNGDPASAPVLHVEYTTGPPINQAPVVNAGSDQTITLPDNSLILNGSVTDDDLPIPPALVTTTWIQLTGPGTVVFDNPALLDAEATFPEPGTYELQLTAYDGEFSVSDEVNITVEDPSANQAPVVNAGSDQTITLPVNSLILNGSVTDDDLPDPPALVTTTWSQLSGPDTVTFDDPGVLDAEATFPQPGLYELQLTADDGELSISDRVIITVQEPGGDATTLQLQVALSSDDAEESSTGAMRLTSSDLELVYDGSDQTVGIRFTGIDIPQGANIMNAYIQFTADKTSSVATSLLIEGEAIDDAPTFTLTNSNISERMRTLAAIPWSPPSWTVGESGLDQQTSDIAPVIQEIVNRSGWSNGNALAVIITGTGKQTAVSYNGNQNAAPVLHVEYTTGPPVNQAPVVNAGSDRVITLPDNSLFLEGSVTDDNLPDPPALLTTTWSQLSGPDTVVFDNPALLDAEATFPEPGTYELQLTADDGEFSVSDEVSITLEDPTANQAPIVNAGSDRSITLPVNSLILNGTVTDDDLPDPPALVTTTWSQLSGPDTVVFDDPSLLDAEATFPEAGPYELQLTADDGELSISDQVIITVQEPGGDVTILEVQVASNYDDAEESSTGAVRLTSSDLELVYDGTDQTVGIRFTGIDIPQGANIMSAYIQFTADKTSSVATSLVIEGEGIDDAPTFTRTNNDISDRMRTLAAIPWIPIAWTRGESGPDQQTPDLSPVIQEIVNRSGWTNGNALAVIITGTGKQTAVAYEGDQNAAPVLHVEYTTGP